MASWPVTTLMNQTKIIAYLKPTCGWSNGVRAVLRKYDLPYEDRDIINDPAQRQEMIEKSERKTSGNHRLYEEDSMRKLLQSLVLFERSSTFSMDLLTNTLTAL